MEIGRNKKKKKWSELKKIDKIRENDKNWKNGQI